MKNKEKLSPRFFSNLLKTEFKGKRTSRFQLRLLDVLHYLSFHDSVNKTISNHIVKITIWTNDQWNIAAEQGADLVAFLNSWRPDSNVASRCHE